MNHQEQTELNECFVICIANKYFNSFNIPIKGNEELYHYSNMLVMNEGTSLKIGLCKRSKTCGPLVELIFKFNETRTNVKNYKLFCERIVSVFIDQSIDDNTVVLSEELLFNLNPLHNYVKGETMHLSVVPKSLENNVTPPRATKIVISPYQCEIPLNANFVDKLFKRYFASPKMMYKNDVFSIEVDKYNEVNMEKATVAIRILYFKVIVIEGSTNELASNEGFLVDGSVTMYQGPNSQGFLPRRYMHLTHKPCFYSLINTKPVLNNLIKNNNNLVPSSFNESFDKLCSCVKPFLFTPQTVQGLCPVFLITGPDGSGKSLLVEAASQAYGVRYWRVDCVTVGGAAPGQGEARLKTVFDKLKTISPCILHLSNVEALCMDGDCKEDIRVMNYFEEQVHNLKMEAPIVIIASSHSFKNVSSNLSHLFLEELSLTTPNCEQRQSIIQWLFQNNSENLNDAVSQAVAAQTSGFGFRDLEVLTNLAFMERFKRTKEDSKEPATFDVLDFNNAIGLMHRAYSESIGAPKVPSVLWKDVGGLEYLKKEIVRSLRSNMFSSGLKRTGLLLHGPPGTGKTLLAKAVATQCGRNFLSVKGPELLNMYVGQSEHNVRDLFELAKSASPCIVFFDELDSLAPNRGRSGDSGGVMDRVVSQLLAEMDNLGPKSDVFILGATNRPDLIDPALLRPGRLDKLLYVGPCEDQSSKLSVLKAVTRKLVLGGDVDLAEIVGLLPPSVTGAQLSAVCSTAWLSSARRLIERGESQGKTSVSVSRDHFISAISSVLGNSS